MPLLNHEAEIIFGKSVQNVDQSGRPIQYSYRTIRSLLSIELLIGDNQDTSLGELIEDYGRTLEEYATQLSLRDDIQKSITSFTQQQQEVLTLRFGLRNSNLVTLAKIAAVIKH